MAEREHILTALVEEVLGPRDGPYEVLPADQEPQGEYITGVLAPASASRLSADIESEADEAAQETGSPDPQEDQDSRGSSVTTGMFSPALDPKALPRSIGISFTLRSTERIPELDICCTWARYHEHRDGWKRQPAAFLTGSIDPTQDRTWNAAEGVRIQLRSRAIPGDTWRVSLFLINTTEQEEPEGRPSVSEHIFQPQIRVDCKTGTELIPVRQTLPEVQSEGESSALTSEDASLDLVYRDRYALARGHLCGAVWEAIDPERPHEDVPSPVQAPFYWTDADQVSEPERSRFSPADVRTEMVPCYPIDAPQMSWDGQLSASPELDPDVLAETWSGQQLKDALEPVAKGYRSWIDDQARLIAALHPDHQVTADSHLDQCREAQRRIEEAIGILVDDEDARLAFCFANRAIAIQSLWARKRVLQWRPFQLAFILLNIAALADQSHPDRNICDLLWFATGGGKTEAYLGLAAFTMALRRRRALTAGHSHAGGGTSVLSRYTLRLLTIQQYRRALGVITAAEVLRVQGLDSPSGPVGWRPREYTGEETFLWGGNRFSAGLWVGGSVTPNGLHSIGPFPSRSGGYPDTFIAGALDILKGAGSGYQGPEKRLQDIAQNTRYIRTEGEPAQVLQCPCCQSVLAVPDQGFPPGQHTLHFLFRGGSKQVPALGRFQPVKLPLAVDDVGVTTISSDVRTLSIKFSVSPGDKLEPRQVDEWWYQTIEQVLGSNTTLLSARPARPGYFIVGYDDRHPCDFDIFCPSPDCELNEHVWAEQVPLARSDKSGGKSGSTPVIGRLPATESTAELPGTKGWQWQDVPSPCGLGGARSLSSRIPIPALTTDDQIYHRCPSVIIATVDKFARLAFESKAASLFGNVTHYHSRWGYYRESVLPSRGGNLDLNYRDHPPGLNAGTTLRTEVSGFEPPDLILQDELHLIEGPLGSMVGIYETAVDALCQGTEETRPKYVASTATVHQADNQVRSLFDRRLAQFPPWGISADDRFFARDVQAHPLDSARAGRLYVGICAPGKGAQTPIVRIWSRLLQTAYERRPVAGDDAIDQFWTLVGYFNAIRELAGALALLRQDIPERITFISSSGSRPLDEDSSLELSGRTGSLDLPSILDRLSTSLPGANDAVLTTSMFGTGVDIERLGMMVVHGQPKTTSSYIQATGRVGRRSGGLIVTFLRASRPRDLDHYEFFTGYHHALYRYVEPITVAPFSPRARERGLGPLSVVLLRQADEISGNPVSPRWRIQQRLSGRYYSEAGRMSANRTSPEVNAIPSIFEARGARQPQGRRPVSNATTREVESELDRWAMLARTYFDTDEFVYSEPSLIRTPRRHVVLGDAQHRSQGLEEAFENAPQSLRDVEDTTGFQI